MSPKREIPSLIDITKFIQVENISVSDFCNLERGCLCSTVTPSTSLNSAERMMGIQGVSHLPVVSGGRVIGLLDRECINIARR